MKLVFDIETGPAPDRELFTPEFKAPSNYKDEAKILSYKEEAKKEWDGRAALSPITGVVLAIGYCKEGEKISAFVDSEKEIIASFLDILPDAEELIGFNCNGFDLPFLFRRAYKHGLSHAIPAWAFEKPWNRPVVDLLDIWAMGTKEFISLDMLSRFLGAGQKNGDGKDFAALLQNNPKLAMEYLHNDIKLTCDCARKLGVPFVYGEG